MICLAMAVLSLCVSRRIGRPVELSDILLGATLTDQPSTRIQICGRLAVEIAGRNVTKLIPRRQGRVLFTYLVANRHRHSSRDQLIEALWAGSVPPDAEGALSSVLSRVGVRSGWFSRRARGSTSRPLRRRSIGPNRRSRRSSGRARGARHLWRSSRLDADSCTARKV